MKIGILTFHRATNYGAILQAYGLVSYLKSQGHEVEVVDYKPSGMGLLYSPIMVPTLFRKLKRIALNVYLLPSLPRRKKKRDMFWNYTERTLPLSRPVCGVETLPNYDAYIVGSDQVWSTKFTGGLDKLYWGQFDKRVAKLISYAGSAAEDMEGSFYATDNAKFLESFNSISVREDELRQYLQSKLTNKTISKVLDPTLLAGREVFDELVNNEKVPVKPYVLVYQVIREKDSEIQKYASMIANSQNCDICEIKNSQLHVSKNGQTKVIPELINPSKFVSLFKHASYIITTSFHGTAFSLLFNRPFSVVSVKPEVDSRAKDLLLQIGIEERMVTLPQFEYNMDINWESVNSRLEQLREPSRSFLDEALK